MANNLLETARGFASTDTANVLLQNSTAETTLYSQTIRGGVMGANKTLRFQVMCSISTVLSVPSLTLRIKLGSSTLVVANALSLVLNATARPLVLEGIIANKNATNAQFVAAWVIQDASNPISLVTGPLAAIADWTEDTTANATFSFTAQMGGLSLSTGLTYRYGSVELS